MTERTAVASRTRSAGARFRAAVAAERPLQIVGAINAYHARLAERSGYRFRAAALPPAHSGCRTSPSARSTTC